MCQGSTWETQYNEKLELKWKGLYIVLAILLNGAYKIADQEGVLCMPVNRNRLKIYNQWFLESIVIIINKPQKFI